MAKRKESNADPANAAFDPVFLVIGKSNSLSGRLCQTLRK